MNSSLALLLRSYVIEHDYTVFPIVPGEKYPGTWVGYQWEPMEEWNSLPPISEERIATWGSWPLESIGLLTGSRSGVVAIDLDNDAHPAWAEIRGFLPDSPVKKRGEKGFTAFYRYGGEPSKKWKDAETKESVIELLSDGRQTVLPPSPHPSGRTYEWITPLTLLTIRRSQLPGLPKDFVERVNALFQVGEKAPPVATDTPSASSRTWTPEKARELLAVLSPALGRDEWLRAGMAIHDLFPGEEGFELWDTWSKGCPEKYNAAHIQSDWRSFKPGRVKFGSLVKMAVEAGYTGEFPKEPVPEVVIQLSPKPSPTPPAPAAPSADDEEDLSADLAISEAYVLGAPGLVGAVADWITMSTTRCQPHFSFAAALSFVGVLKGHRVQTARRNRTNHMTLAIGKSGSSKSEVGSRIDDLITACGLDDLAMGIPTSDSGLRQGLSARNGRAFMYWDEMGLALELMLGKNSPTHTRQIKDILIELWTKAHQVLRKKEMADELARKRQQDIIQPCLGIYGTAQPDIFYQALGTTSAADGFFPRLLVFETPNNYPKEQAVLDPTPPARLVEYCREIQSWPTNASPKGNLSSLVIDPRVVPIAPDAKPLLDAAKADVERKLTRLSDSLTSGVWARSLSHMEKIALTAEEGPAITRDTLAWSIDLVLQLSSAMSAAFKLRVSDSENEKRKKSVLELILKAGHTGISQNMITRRTQALRDKREREGILNDLEVGGFVVFRDEATGGRAVRTYYATKYAPPIRTAS